MLDLTFVDALFIMFLVSADVLLLDIIHKFNAKKSNYDCFKCKNWDCMQSFCSKKRGD